MASTLFNNIKKLALIFLSFAVTLGIWFAPIPNGVQPQAWALFAIFLGTITLIVSNALPMGAATLIGLTGATLTKTLTFAEAFSGYNNNVTWLILIAFFIAHGFIETGLGTRIAYWFVRLLGRKTLSLAYGLSFADLMLAPVIPSVTARLGGTLYPIVQSLSFAFDSRPTDGTERRIGTYLTLTSFQVTTITSGMFLTAMAANPLAAKLAGNLGIEISWTTWAMGAIVPGLISLMIAPWLAYKLSPPDLKETPQAVEMATLKLKEMGSMKAKEIRMMIGFLGLLTLWVGEKTFGISPVVAALLGLSYLLITNVFTWKSLLELTNAWDTFIWFGALVAMAEGMNNLGLTTWFGQWASLHLSGTNWMIACLVMFLIYYYSHYFFASSTAHVGALYLPFVMVALQLGAPPLPTALLFAYASNLFGGLTHYGCGPAPILFGAGFVSLKEWWYVGFVFSVVNIVIWLSVGSLWWIALGWS